MRNRTRYVHVSMKIIVYLQTFVKLLLLQMHILYVRVS